jgi:DNA-binding PadR family transcriptional regulator
MIQKMELQEVLKKASPLTEASYYILVALAEPLHGYGVMQKVEELSRGRVQLGPGTLYGALSNLQSFGLIEGVEDAGANDRRKLYRMTEVGRKVAEHEVERFDEMARHGRQLLGL